MRPARSLDRMADPVAENDAIESGSSADRFSADWRVLLPAPPEGTFSSLLLLGGNRELAALLVAVGVARRVFLEIPSDSRIDAVVRVAGAGAASPDDVLPCMLPDSAIYWELDQDSRLWLQPRLRRIRERLQRAGFDSWALYEGSPNFHDAEAYRPVDAGNAEHWYRNQRERRPGLSAPWAPRRPPSRYAFIVARGNSWERSSSAGILQRLPSGVLPSASRVLVVRRRGRRDRNRRLIVFAFSSSEPEPVGILKISRTAEDRSRIEAEQRALVAIRANIEPGMQASLPMPLGCFEAGTSLVGVETCLGGRQRARGLSERRRQLELAASWIADFHRQTEVSRDAWGPGEVEKWIARPIAEYRKKFGAGDREHRLFEALLGRGRALLGQSLPLVWRHGDFNESNIFFAAQSLRVVDWEAARIGLPLFDLLYFATNWIFRTERLTDPADRLRRFKRVLVERGDAGDETSRFVWKALDGYLAKLAIDRRFVALLIGLHSFEWDAREEVLALADGWETMFGRTHA